MVSEQDIRQALAILDDKRAAEARAAHEFFSDLTKTVLAELMLESNESSAAAREMHARAHPKFREHLEKVGKYARMDYEFRQQQSAASAKIEIFRTLSANERNATR